MTRTLLKICLAAMVIATIGLNAVPGYAQGEQIGTSGQWEVFRTGSGADMTCFITSVPIKYEGDYDRNNRGETRVYVTHHGTDPEHRGIVSVVAGYRYKEGEEVLFTIDGSSKFSLFSVETRAWARKPADDKGLIQAMKRGRTLKVKGISTPGNTTLDTYSLTGFTKAMGMIDKACG